MCSPCPRTVATCRTCSGYGAVAAHVNTVTKPSDYIKGGSVLTSLANVSFTRLFRVCLSQSGNASWTIRPTGWDTVVGSSQNPRCWFATLLRTLCKGTHHRNACLSRKPFYRPWWRFMKETVNLFIAGFKFCSITWGAVSTAAGK
jgi:hypothetical protein